MFYIPIHKKTVKMTDIHRLLKTALKAAKKAGKYIKSRYQKGDAEITANHKHDVKLDVDVKTEEIIKEVILKRFPDHALLCEESGETTGNEENLWIIDPLDGTVNFVNGIPHFCTSIAFKHKDKYQIGVVFDPIRNEIFYGARNIGVFVNDIPIKRKGVKSLSEAIVSGGFFKKRSINIGSNIFQNLAPNIKKIRFFGSAALDLCYLAAGRFNVYLQYHLHEWDIAAGLLLAELSGLKIATYKNKDIYNVVASDPEIFDDLHNFLNSIK